MAVKLEIKNKHNFPWAFNGKMLSKKKIIFYLLKRNLKFIGKYEIETEKQEMQKQIVVNLNVPKNAMKPIAIGRLVWL